MSEKSAQFDASLVPLLLRLALAMLFLTAGLGKFIGPGPTHFMEALARDFQGTFLPLFLVRPFAYMLPFLETALGLFLLAGLYRRTALIGTALLLIALSFGKAILGDFQIVAQNFIFLYGTVWTLLFAENDRYNFDRFFTDKQ